MAGVGLLSRMPGFDPGSVYGGFAAEAVRLQSAITKIIKQFTSGTSYLMNRRLHVSVPIGPSSGLLMNQVSNAAYMLGTQYVYNWCSLIYLK
jgi:hypothetical protein